MTEEQDKILRLLGTAFVQNRIQEGLRDHHQSELMRRYEDYSQRTYDLGDEEIYDPNDNKTEFLQPLLDISAELANTIANLSIVLGLDFNKYETLRNNK